MTNPSFTQTVFRLRNDDGSQTTATWKQNENVNDTINANENFRARFVIDETNSRAWTNKNWTLYYDLNGGGYLAVTASTPVQFSASTNFTDGDDTTAQLTAPTGTFVTNNNAMKETTGGATNSGTSGQYFEIEFCLKIDATQVTDGDTISLRIRDGTAVLTAYSNTPAITVNDVITVLPNTAVLSATGRTITVSAPLPATNIPLDTAGLTATGQTSTVYNVFNIVLAGGGTPSGVLSKQDNKTFVGGLTPDGPTGYHLSYAKPYSGGISSSGVLTKYKATLKSFAGGDTPSGALGKALSKLFSGSLSSVGTLTKGTLKTLTGGITPSGILSKTRTAVRAFTGYLIPSGPISYTKSAEKTFTGDITPDGLLSRNINLRTASISASGRTITIVAQSASINIPLATAVMTSGSSISVVKGAVTKALNTGALSATGRSLTVAKGAVSPAMSAGQITANGRSLTINSTVNLSTAILVALGGTSSISAPAPGISISLDEAQLVSNGQSLQVLKGAVTISLSAGQLVTSSTLTILRTILLATGSVQATGQSLAILKGAVSIVLNTAQLVATPQTSYIGKWIKLGVAQVSSSGRTTTLALGAVSRPLQAGQLTATGRISSILAPITRSLNTASITANGRSLTINSTVNLNKAQLTAYGRTITVSAPLPGETNISLLTAQAVITGRTASLVPGAVSKALSVATLSATGRTISVGSIVTISLGTGQITVNGQALSVLKGTATVQLNNGQISSLGRTLSILVGSVTVGLDTGEVVTTGQPAIITTGVAPQTVALNTGAISTSGQTTSIIPGNITANLNKAVINASGTHLSPLPGPINIGLDNGIISVNGVPLSILVGLLFIGHVIVTDYSGEVAMDDETAWLLAMQEKLFGTAELIDSQ